MEMGTRVFQTADIALASYLYCSGIHLVKVDRQNPRRCLFILDSPDSELISKWQEGRATVNGLAFYNAYQALKAKLFRGDL